MSSIQQTYALLQQMYSLMQQLENQSQVTKQEVEKATVKALQLQQIINRSIILFRRMGLPEDIDSAIYKMQRLISIINQVRLATLALYAGPGGIILGGLGLLMVALDVGDLMAS